MREHNASSLPRFTITAAAAAALLLCQQAGAQQATPAAPAASAPAAQTGPLERVEVTGSIIRRKASDEEALPVTIIRAVELTTRGHTELKDFMLELPQANSLGTNAGTAGPMTSLRGFGPMRTLTLLNGKRLAKEPLTNQYTSVNVIPRMALDRVEVLRDGASSSYGSDAIGGVQAFYTYNKYLGGAARVEWVTPQAGSAGQIKQIGAIKGIGDLNKDGWNLYATVDVQQRQAVLRTDRPELVDGAALTQLGISTAPGLGANATPGNFTDPTNPTTSLRTVRYNPYYSSGCLPPYSVPSTSGGRQTCFLDANVQYTSFSNANDIGNFYTKGTMRLGTDHQVAVEFNHSKFLVAQYNNPAAPTVRLNSTHPYYPGNGIVPAVPAANLGGRPIDVLWSTADAGPRIRNDYHTNDRLALTAQGTVGEWDYRGGINYGEVKRETQAGEGWLRITGIAGVQGTSSRTLFLDPKLNPFGLQNAQGLALLDAASINGQPLRIHKAGIAGADAVLSRDLMQLPGGAMKIAVGTEFIRDRWQAIGLASNDLAASLNGQIDLLGGDAQAQGAVSASSVKISRDIMSTFAEIDAPVRKDLTLNASVRADRYSDLKETTINPKLSVRFQPMSNLVLRGSTNTGFRAPSLPEIYTKETERTSIPTFNDPLHCPTGTAAPGFAPELVCGLTGYNQITKVPNNANVKPETSKSFTFGAAFEPAKNLIVTADYWRTQIDNVIGNRAIDFLLANPTTYPGLFLRNPDGTLGVLNAAGGRDAVINTPSNVGALLGAGIDFSAKYTWPRASWGLVSAGIDVAYLTEWKAKSEGFNGGNWVSALGYYNDVVPVNPNAGISNATRGLNNRWRHTAQVTWSNTDWLVQLSQRFQSAIVDQNSAAATGPGTTGPRKVAKYAQYNLVVKYTAVKDLTLGLTVGNLTNANPPLTNHTGYRGYLTSVADVLGRTYGLSAEYKF